MRLLLWLLPTGVAALVVASFVVSNRNPVEIGLWPFDSYSMPLFAVVLAAVMVGYLAGLCVSWWRHGKIRAERRRHARRIEVLEADLARPRPESPPHESDSRALRV